MTGTSRSTTSRPAAGGGRWVEVPPDRLARWIDGFAERHGPFTVTADGSVTALTAPDGARAELHPPFPPVAPGTDPLAALTAHVALPRRVGVLLVRLGGYAAGIFDGDRLVNSKVDSRLVHGRHKKGGSSQARFARRREGEVRQVVDAAVEIAVRILLPEVSTLDAVVLGGDRRAVDLVLADRRLAAVSALVTGPFLTVADPRRAVLEGTPATFRAVRIRVTD